MLLKDDSLGQMPWARSVSEDKTYLIDIDCINSDELALL